MAKLIGTAGHVDHGKTTLIRALTGIDADRLPEEKQRGMTIDIGFAFIDLPPHGRVSIVDVPGHERFLTNMLVGALGIDLALLCVAADESVMPQTREHMQILELLPVERLVVAVTRSDLADAETREIARLEIDELLAESRFGDCPVMEVSAQTGEGIQDLKRVLAEALSASGDEARDAHLPWYLPVDRAFSVKGHGCVVTGTLAQGSVRVGDVAYLEPGHQEVRVRAIHSHGEALNEGEQGRRTALNLSGVRLEDVRRGQALGQAGALFETSMLDASVRWLVQPKHGARVRVSIGAEEAIAKVFLSLEDPSQAQLRLETEVAAAKSQPLIVRRYSPPDLLGGGRVTVPQATARRRSEAAVQISAGSDEEAIMQVLDRHPDGVETAEICRQLGKTPQALGDTFESLARSGRVRGFAGLWFSGESFARSRSRFLEVLERLHDQNPTQASLPREKIVQAAGLPWSGKPLDRIISALDEEGAIKVQGTGIRSASFRVRLSPRQREFLDRVLEQVEKEAVSTPAPLDIARALGTPIQAVEEIIQLGIQAGELVQIGDGVVYTPGQIRSLQDRVRDLAGAGGFTAAQVRDAFGTTRKYVIPLLEYFDSTRFTIRQGDQRRIS